MNHILCIKELSISFHSKIAVDEISFNVPKGKTLALVGESGSGKSVIALSILGLLPTYSTVYGKILFSGNQLVGLSASKLRNVRGSGVAMIFQEPMTSLNPVFTICEQIEEVVRVHRSLSRKSIRRVTLEAMEEVGLPLDRINSYPHEFSGGMRQRVMIAMALVSEPTLLIADEPTTALDSTTSNQIVKLLIEVKNRRGMSMLFISHDLGLVSLIADKICVIRSGKKIESGDAAEVLQKPKEAYTQALLACRPSLVERHERLRTIQEFIK
ncbi:MAG: ABC transporter ATP-binding protein [Planctomycetota bacterium]|nr:ABC transporter ATP-binding protein [Planctomycetota bacterium]